MKRIILRSLLPLMIFLLGACSPQNTPIEPSDPPRLIPSPTATTTDFISVAEEISEQDLDSFFDSWLYQEDIPDIPEMGLYRTDYAP